LAMLARVAGTSLKIAPPVGSLNAVSVSIIAAPFGLCEDFRSIDTRHRGNPYRRRR
jgi:hypothetical protein